MFVVSTGYMVVIFQNRQWLYCAVQPAVQRIFSKFEVWIEIRKCASWWQTASSWFLYPCTCTCFLVQGMVVRYGICISDLNTQESPADGMPFEMAPQSSFQAGSQIMLLLMHPPVAWGPWPVARCLMCEALEHMGCICCWHSSFRELLSRELGSLESDDSVCFLVIYWKQYLECCPLCSAKWHLIGEEFCPSD